jgi:hypothetical protein
MSVSFILNLLSELNKNILRDPLALNSVINLHEFNILFYHIPKNKDRLK